MFAKDTAMIRQLCGLNAQDVRQELNEIGVDQFERQAHSRSFQHDIVIKISGYETDGLRRIADRLTQNAGAKIYTNWEIAVSPGIIACFGPEEIFRLKSAPIDWRDAVGQFYPALTTFIENIERDAWEYQIPGGTLKIDRPLVMGILNVTPDSFSDGGTFFDPESGYRRAMEMLENGADIIDIGGESTRPGAAGVSVDEEWERVGAIIGRLAKTPGCVISVDTYKSEVARRAMNAGAHIINDISGATFDPAIADVAAKFNAPLVLMHIRGKPRTMQKNPVYGNLMEDIYLKLARQCDLVKARGVSQIIVDPGIGFGKKLTDNFEILRRLKEFRALGFPVLLGASRKSFIGKVLDVSVEERLAGTIASNLYGVYAGANILRVHDVREIHQCMQILQAIRTQKTAATLVKW